MLSPADNPVTRPPRLPKRPTTPDPDYQKSLGVMKKVMASHLQCLPLSATSPNANAKDAKGNNTSTRKPVRLFTGGLNVKPSPEPRPKRQRSPTAQHTHPH